MMSSYANNLTLTPCEVRVLMNSHEPNMLLKTVLRRNILFPDSRSLVGKVPRKRWPFYRQSTLITLSQHILTFKKKTFNNM